MLLFFSFWSFLKKKEWNTGKEGEAIGRLVRWRRGWVEKGQRRVGFVVSLVGGKKNKCACLSGSRLGRSAMRGWKRDGKRREEHRAMSNEIRRRGDRVTLTMKIHSGQRTRRRAAFATTGYLALLNRATGMRNPSSCPSFHITPWPSRP